MIARRNLPRRTFLRGAGTAIALPLLDAMIPAFARADSGAKPPLRMAFVYVPNGIVMPDWTPAEEGADFALPSILQPLEPLRDRLLVLSGLTQNGGRALGDGAGDHARAAGCFLTGVHPRKTSGADIQAGVSVDQVAAQAVGQATRFSSLELGCEDGRLVGDCDSGYSCAYSNSISWRTPSTPLPPETNPRLVFERFFGTDTDEDPAARSRRLISRKSVLDYVSDDARQLVGKLGPTDRRKMDEYMTGVREIERRIDVTGRETREIAPSMAKPEGIPLDFAQHSRLLFDLLTLAFQADLTRVATFMLAREGSSRAYREIGISDAHHPLTHHRNDPDMVAKVSRINRYHMEQFAAFLEKLKSIREGDGTLLDNAMIVYGSGIADGNRHTHNNLPVVMAGGGAGTLRSGRHLRFPAETPMANLFLSMLDRMGVKPESIGDSNGRLEHLSEL